MRKKKKLLPQSTPDADTLLALHGRMIKDIEIMEKMPLSTIEKKKYPLDELTKGVLWLEWLEKEKRNEERRLKNEST